MAQAPPQAITSPNRDFDEVDPLGWWMPDAPKGVKIGVLVAVGVSLVLVVLAVWYVIRRWKQRNLSFESPSFKAVSFTSTQGCDAEKGTSVLSEWEQAGNAPSKQGSNHLPATQDAKPTERKSAALAKKSTASDSTPAQDVRSTDVISRRRSSEDDVDATAPDALLGHRRSPSDQLHDSSIYAAPSVTPGTAVAGLKRSLDGASPRRQHGSPPQQQQQHGSTLQYADQFDVGSPTSVSARDEAPSTPQARAPSKRRVTFDPAVPLHTDPASPRSVQLTHGPRSKAEHGFGSCGGVSGGSGSSGSGSGTSVAALYGVCRTDPEVERRLRAAMFEATGAPELSDSGPKRPLGLFTSGSMRGRAKGQGQEEQPNLTPTKAAAPHGLRNTTSEGDDAGPVQVSDQQALAAQPGSTPPGATGAVSAASVAAASMPVHSQHPSTVVSSASTPSPATEASTSYLAGPGADPSQLHEAQGRRGSVHLERVGVTPNPVYAGQGGSPVGMCTPEASGSSSRQWGSPAQAAAGPHGNRRVSLPPDQAHQMADGQGPGQLAPHHRPYRSELGTGTTIAMQAPVGSEPSSGPLNFSQLLSSGTPAAAAAAAAGTSQAAPPLLSSPYSPQQYQAPGHATPGASGTTPHPAPGYLYTPSPLPPLGRGSRYPNAANALSLANLPQKRMQQQQQLYSSPSSSSLYGSPSPPQFSSGPQRGPFYAAGQDRSSEAFSSNAAWSTASTSAVGLNKLDESGPVATAAQDFSAAAAAAASPAVQPYVATSTQYAPAPVSAAGSPPVPLPWQEWVGAGTSAAAAAAGDGSSSRGAWEPASWGAAAAAPGTMPWQQVVTNEAAFLPPSPQATMNGATGGPLASGVTSLHAQGHMRTPSDGSEVCAQVLGSRSFNQGGSGAETSVEGMMTANPLYSSMDSAGSSELNIVAAGTVSPARLSTGPSILSVFAERGAGRR